MTKPVSANEFATAWTSSDSLTEVVGKLGGRMNARSVTRRYRRYLGMGVVLKTLGPALPVREFPRIFREASTA